MSAMCTAVISAYFEKCQFSTAASSRGCGSQANFFKFGRGPQKKLERSMTFLMQICGGINISREKRVLLAKPIGGKLVEAKVLGRGGDPSKRSDWRRWLWQRSCWRPSRTRSVL